MKVIAILMVTDEPHWWQLGGQQKVEWQELWHVVIDTESQIGGNYSFLM